MNYLIKELISDEMLYEIINNMDNYDNRLLISNKVYLLFNNAKLVGYINLYKEPELKDDIYTLSFKLKIGESIDDNIINQILDKIGNDNFIVGLNKEFNSNDLQSGNVIDKYYRLLNTQREQEFNDKYNNKIYIIKKIINSRKHYGKNSKNL